MRTARALPKLTDEEIKERNKVVEELYPRIMKLANKLSKRIGGRLTADDLCHIGMLRIMQGWHRFDPSLGFQPITYFGTAARRAMEREIKIARGVIIVPEQTPCEGKYREDAERAWHYTSLDRPVLEGDKKLISVAFDEKAPNPVLECIKNENREVLEYCLNRIHKKYREVLQLRMQGFLLSEIGKQLNLTRERVRQIEARGLKKLEKLLKKTADLSADCFIKTPKGVHISQPLLEVLEGDVRVPSVDPHPVLRGAVLYTPGVSPERALLRSLDPALSKEQIEKIFQEKGIPFNRSAYYNWRNREGRIASTGTNGYHSQGTYQKSEEPTKKVEEEKPWRTQRDINSLLLDLAKLVSEFGGVDSTRKGLDILEALTKCVNGRVG